MAGYPINFHVSAGNPVLKHPLYLKWNIRTIEYVIDNKATLKTDIMGVMATNDNMPVLWYLNSLYRIVNVLA